MSIILNAEQYDGFYSIVNLLKEYCNDIDIQHGQIRQKSTNQRTIFEIDLSDILGDVNIPITIIKQKIDLLRMFIGSDNIEIDIDDDTFTFKDEFSKITFVKPNYEFIDNEFITDDEITNIFSWDEQEEVCSINISQKICDRMKIIAANYDIDLFQIVFDDDVATIKAITESRDRSATIVENIPLDLRIKDEICELTAIPFIVDRDTQLQFELFSDGSTVLINKSTSSIKNIDFTIYARTQFMVQ